MCKRNYNTLSDYLRTLVIYWEGLCSRAVFSVRTGTDSETCRDIQGQSTLLYLTLCLMGVFEKH